MPSTNQPAETRDRQEFPSLREDIGEDPARWLDREIVGVGSRADVVKSLIRGMDSIQRVRAWKAVERHPQVGPDEQPREGIIRLLEQREAWLDDHGERPDRLPHGPRLPPDMFDTESAAERRGGERTSALDKVQSGAVATDGGEQR